MRSDAIQRYRKDISWTGVRDMNDTFKEIAASLAAIGFIAVLIVLAGLAGGLENDVIDTGRYIRGTLICLAVLGTSVAVLNYAEKDENEFDRL